MLGKRLICDYGKSNSAPKSTQGGERRGGFSTFCTSVRIPFFRSLFSARHGWAKKKVSTYPNIIKAGDNRREWGARVICLLPRRVEGRGVGNGQRLLTQHAHWPWSQTAVISKGKQEQKVSESGPTDGTRTGHGTDRINYLPIYLYTQPTALLHHVSVKVGPKSRVERTQKLSKGSLTHEELLELLPQTKFKQPCCNDRLYNTLEYTNIKST